MPNHDRGFSLVESLIAIAILAGSVSTILIVIASNSGRSADSLARLRAVFAADAILTRVGLDIPLAPQQINGRLRDGSIWSVDISPYVEPEFSPDMTNRLLAVTVAVSPQRTTGGNVTVKTLKRIGY